MLYKFLLVAAIFLLTIVGAAQDSSYYSKYRVPDRIVAWGYKSLYQKNDSQYILLGICKNYGVVVSNKEFILSESHASNKKTSSPPFLTVHGTVQYDFQYRSFVDTPFYQYGFQQHTIQAALKLSLKDQVPLTLHLSTSQNNSPYFKNVGNVNLQFDRYAYLSNAKQQLLNRIEKEYYKRAGLAVLQTALQNEMDKYHSLKGWLNSPDILQRLVEEKERLLYTDNSSGSMPLPDSSITIKDFRDKIYKTKSYTAAGDAANDDSRPSYTSYIQEKRKELDSLQQTINQLQHQTDSVKSSVSQTILFIRQKVYQAKNLKELHSVQAANGLINEQGKANDHWLSKIRTLRLGKSMVNYSELTAWNVSLTGLNIEYNNRIYSALSVGKIDYGFSNFFGKSKVQHGQNFFMYRIGVGNVDHKALIFSGFTGRKYNYGGFLTSASSASTHVVGYSVEALLKKDEHTHLALEIGKTTQPVDRDVEKKIALKGLADFSTHSNLGINIKGQKRWASTGTQLSGFYRQVGEYFQSFSLFSYNTDQKAWIIKGEQSFDQDKITLVALLRRNDFTNPFTEKTFKTSTVFKSFQINVRYPKWPMVSAGYIPGSQLFVIDKDRVRENAYYILNGSVVHQYTIKQIRMLSSAIYNRYSSKGTDSGFISYKGINYMASQQVLLDRVQLQAAYNYTDGEQMQFYTGEAGADITITPAFRIGVSGKYHQIISGKKYMGGRLQIGFDVKKLGRLQLQYEKSYLPTVQKTLFPIEIGRVSWAKNF